MKREEERKGKERRGKERRGEEGRGEERRGEERRGKTRRDETRRDETRREEKRGEEKRRVEKALSGNILSKTQVNRAVKTSLHCQSVAVGGQTSSLQFSVCGSRRKGAVSPSNASIAAPPESRISNTVS